MRPVASTTCDPSNSNASRTTMTTDSMTTSSPPPRLRRRKRDDLLERLRVDGLALRERADRRVDRAEEEPERADAAGDEREVGVAAARGRVACRALGLGERGEHLAHRPPEPPLHDLLHHAPEVRRRLVVILP